MRYAIAYKGMSPTQVEAELRRAGATDIRVAQRISQVFCELDDAQVKKLACIPGLKVKPVREYRRLKIF